jgi:hypothetical protein
MAADPKAKKSAEDIAMRFRDPPATRDEARAAADDAMVCGADRRNADRRIGGWGRIVDEGRRMSGS